MRQTQTESAAAVLPDRRCPPAPSEIHSTPQEGDVMTTDPRSARSSDDRDYPPGPLAGVKRGATSDPGYPQPQAAEVESARLLANQARPRLHAEGFSDQDIDRLADDFIAEDRGEQTGAFIDWAHHVRRGAKAAHGAVDARLLTLRAGSNGQSG
jgi:hypothetical protein